MRRPYVSIVTNDIYTSDIIFTSEDGASLGSLRINDEGKFEFTPSLSNLSESTGTNENGNSIDLGTNYSDYLYYDNSDQKWKIDGSKVHIGSNAGQTGQGINSIAIGSGAGKTNQHDHSIVINATGTEMNSAGIGQTHIKPIREQLPTGISNIGNISVVSNNGQTTETILGFPNQAVSSQSTNVMSYNSESGEVTFRELGLYHDTVNGFQTVGSEDTNRIISKYSIIPNINASKINSTGYNLGSKGASWNTVYTKDIFISTNTMYVEDETTGSTMIVKYDPDSLSTTLSNEKITVKSVNTSSSIPGQIDPSLLPFTGLSFIGQFNPVLYSTNVGSNFDTQTENMLQTLNYSVINSPVTFDSHTPITTNNIFKMLSGVYFTVYSPNIPIIPMTFSTLRAETDLQDFDKRLIGNITSNFVASNPVTYNLKDNDTLILSIILQYNEQDSTKIDIIVHWSQVEFKVPIGGVSTLNIMDYAVTNLKLANNSVNTINLINFSVTNDKLADNSISTDKLIDYSVNNNKLANNSIGTSKLIDSCVTNSKLSTNCVSQDNIKNGAVTYTKLSSEVQTLISNSGNSASQESVSTLINLVNSLNTKLSETQDELLQIKKNYENKFLAIEEYIQNMQKTYIISRAGQSNFTFDGSFQNIMSSGINLVATTSTNIVIELNKYIYNILNNKLSVIDRTGTIIQTLTRSNFDSINYRATINTINEQKPLTLEIRDLSEKVILRLNII
jgi:hypothetical protein